MTNYEACPGCRRSLVIEGRVIPGFPLWVEAHCPACGENLGLFRNDIGAIRIELDRAVAARRTA